jgi:hypothetical protein
VKTEKAAGLWPWPNNAARHSYISYRLSLVEDVAKVALEAGHDPKTLAQWYRRPILKADAEAYFKISTNPSSATLPPPGFFSAQKPSKESPTNSAA